MIKEGDAPVGSPGKVMLLHLLTAPANSTCKQHLLPTLLTSLHASRGFGGGCPPALSQDQVPLKMTSPSCSDLAAQGRSSAELEEGGGEGGAKQQEAQIDLFLPPLL